MISAKEALQMANASKSSVSYLAWITSVKIDQHIRRAAKEGATNLDKEYFYNDVSLAKLIQIKSYIGECLDNKGFSHQIDVFNKIQGIDRIRVRIWWG